MLIKDEVIVLGLVRYKEKNLILKCFSKSHGIQSFFTTLSSGKSKHKNYYQAFSILELVYKKDNKSELLRIKENKNIHLLLGLRSSVSKNAMAFLLAEVIGKCIREEESNEALYSFIESQILLLDSCEKHYANFHLYCLVQLSKYIGINPSYKNNFCCFDIKEGVFAESIPLHPHYLGKENAVLLQQLLLLTWEEVQEIKLNGNHRSQFLHELIQYYQYHVPGFQVPKSLEILEEVFHA